MKPHVTVIVGPTGVGKSGLGIMVAELLDGEIVSADSMQVYRRMDIGTAKITPEEARGIPHHLIDIVEPGYEFTVAEYVRRADEAIAGIASRGRVPLLVGGTGLYVKSLLEYYLFPDTGADWDYRREMEALAQREGNEALFGMLKRVDPEAAVKLHPNDRKRVIRALEVFRNTGKPMSSQIAMHQPAEPRYESLRIGLACERGELYRRIDLRVDLMMASGLVEEVRSLMDDGLGESITAIQALGYKEIVDHLNGLCSLEEAVDTIKRESRRYAKRQLSWFNRDKAIRWFHREEWPDMEALAQRIVDLREGSPEHIGENQ